MGDRLAGRVIVVTGASGIAAAAARRFAAEGASVGIVSLERDETAALAASVSAAGVTLGSNAARSWNVRA